ncbi:gamma-glutamylcyclotransferase family protein [Streptomyces sp. NPDC048192]|uniref:gamma-glutamylcyclotransferase family protein n=1 Tax=Streptomyces sp. NPDC048192 TaxID=3365510 RepID=UPI0037191B1C
MGLFSYGALQERPVQQLILGRTLEGRADQLPGFILTVAELGEEAALVSGTSRHPMATLGATAGAHVCGTLYRVLPADLSAIDARCDILFHRVTLLLRSGEQAWVYVDRRYRPPARAAAHPSTAAVAACARQASTV